MSKVLCTKCTILYLYRGHFRLVKIFMKYMFTRKLLTVSGDVTSCHGRPRLGYHGKPGQLHCDYCGRVFPYPSAMEKHIRSHTKEKPYKCGICDKAFTQQYNLCQHLLTHPKTSTKTPFKCGFCDKAFNQKFSLSRHLLTNSNSSRPNQFEMKIPATAVTTRTPKPLNGSPSVKRNAIQNSKLSQTDTV